MPSAQAYEEATFSPESESAMCLSEAGGALANRNGAVQARIAELVAIGRFVVVRESTAYCRATDAIVGVALSVVNHFGNRSSAEAEAAARIAKGDGEDSFAVHPRLPGLAVPRPTDASEADVPF